MALMMAMRGAPPMIGPSAIGAVNSALLLEDSVALATATALANQARASVSDGQFSFCGIAVGEANAGPENFEETRTHKAEIIAALEQGFAYCERIFARTSDAGAADAADFFGAPNTVGGMLAFNSVHNYEHYGNLVTYMRINGIVPPSSR